jgi:hypothetical protein
MVQRRKLQKGKKRAEAVQRRAERKRKAAEKEQRRKAKPRMIKVQAAAKPARKPPWFLRIAASIAIALMPGLVGKARAGAHPIAPPNPAVFRGVEARQIVSKYLYHPTDRRQSFNMLRYSQKATPGGPVITFDRVMPHKGGPQGIKLDGPRA